MKKKPMNDLAKSIAKRMIDRDMGEWPPGCFALSYQPVLPMKKKQNASDPQFKTDQNAISKKLDTI